MTRFSHFKPLLLALFLAAFAPIASSKVTTLLDGSASVKKQKRRSSASRAAKRHLRQRSLDGSFTSCDTSQAYPSDSTKQADNVTVFEGACSWKEVLKSNSLDIDPDDRLTTDIADLTNVALSQDGLTVVIGETSAFENLGRVKAFSRKSYTSSEWQPKGTPLKGKYAYDFLGLSLDVSQDGNTFAASSFNSFNQDIEHEGQIQLYRFNGTDWDWARTYKGLTKYLLLGKHLELSGDGNTLAYTIPFFQQNPPVEDRVAYDPDFDPSKKRPFGKIMVRQFTDEDGDGQREWSVKGKGLVAKDDEILGFLDMALSGDANTLVFSTGSDVNSTVEVYEFSDSSKEWEMVTEIEPQPGSVQEAFGSRISLSTNGMVMAIADSKWHDGVNVTGRVLIYNKVDGNWIFTKEFEGAEPGDDFGSDVSLDDEGITLVIGASGANAEDGYVEVYRFDGTEWNLQSGEIDDEFTDEGNLSGTRVHVSGDGRSMCFSSNNNHEVRCFSYF